MDGLCLHVNFRVNKCVPKVRRLSWISEGLKVLIKQNKHFIFETLKSPESCLNLCNLPTKCKNIKSCDHKIFYITPSSIKTNDKYFWNFNIIYKNRQDACVMS